MITRFTGLNIAKSVYVLLFCTTLSTARLEWLVALSVYSVASLRFNEPSNPIAYVKLKRDKRKNLLNAIDEQQQALNEREHELNELTAALEEQRELQEQQLNEYASNLKSSATDQVQAIIDDYEQRLSMLLDEKRLLLNQVAHCEEIIHELQAPRLPEGSDPASLLASKLCQFLNNHRIPVDYERCWYDSGEVMVWVKPRKGGSKQIEKYLDEIHLQLNLLKRPLVSVINGMVQIAMKPEPYSDEQPLNEHYTRGISYESTEHAVKMLTNAWNKSAPSRPIDGFIEPLIPIQPVGGISKIEKDWVTKLFYDGLVKKQIIARVYGITSTRAHAYAAASDRYDSIIQTFRVTDE